MRTDLGLEEGDTLVDSLLDPTVRAHLARASIPCNSDDVSKSESVSIHLHCLPGIE
jgi:hypothetical protein